MTPRSPPRWRGSYRHGRSRRGLDGTDSIVWSQGQHQLCLNKSSSCSSLYNCTMLLRKTSKQPQNPRQGSQRTSCQQGKGCWIRYHPQVSGTKEEGRPSPVQGQLSPVEAHGDDGFAAAAPQLVPHQVGGVAVETNTQQGFAVGQKSLKCLFFPVSEPAGWGERDAELTPCPCTGRSKPQGTFCGMDTMKVFSASHTKQVFLCG